MDPLALKPSANVLLVDDREENLRVFEVILQGLGAELVKATSGQEALRLLLEKDFAVILLDVLMPDMDGFETALLIRGRAKSRYTPIIFVTGQDASAENIAKGYFAGAVDYIFKPFIPEILQSKVRFFLELYHKTQELSRTNQQLQEEILERRRAEEESHRVNAQLLQGQKLQAIGQLVAGIAHEINNPVGYILSNLGTMGSELDDIERIVREARKATERLRAGEDAGRVREEMDRGIDGCDGDFLLDDFKAAVRDCKEGAARIRDIVGNLKAFSHSDEGEVRPTDLKQCLEESLRLCWNELKYKVDVRREYGDLPLVPVNPQRLGQVFVNLLVNAAQAIEKRGEILLSTKLEGDRATVRIQDTGCGIAPENMKRVFEPFFTTKPVGKGTGLGLHVVYKIIRGHGGDIRVRSEQGKGTEIVIALPLEKTAAGKESA